MSTPLILQIQAAALDSSSSVTDALRKAKLACAKLGLTEFGDWVNLELNGYMDKSSEEVPEYRKLHGIPEAFSPFQGWLPLTFATSQQQKAWALAVVGMTIPALEESVRSASGSPGGVFGFPYPPEVQNEICQSLTWGDSPLRIRLGVSQTANILSAVRNILLDWTVEMEKQGVLGNELSFTQEDRVKSAAVTAETVNHIHIEKVGAFVQHAAQSVVQGGVESAIGLTEGVRNLVEQLEQLLPAANLPSQVQQDTRAAVDELKEATGSASPDTGRLRKGLQNLKRVLAPAGERLVTIAVDAAVTKLLDPGP